ncbi:hypothetical protein ACOZ4N_00155 (plasmid) [Halorientalis pallida]|uniref:hypothetical protein n=1 Tax=Halorientalis pallida TaxID=2479928 RepID=UPI003C6FB304
MFQAADESFIGKVHCSGRPDRNYSSIWADFPEEADWIEEYPDKRVLGIWLDINEANPSQSDFIEDRDNFIPVTAQQLTRHLNNRDALHIEVESIAADRYKIESTPAHTNDWSVIFE